MGELVPFPAPSREPYLTKAQAARYLGRSTRWVELRHADGLPSKKVCGQRMYRASELDAWVRSMDTS